MKKIVLSLCLFAVMALGNNSWAALTDYNSGSMSTFTGAVIPGMTATGDAWAGGKISKGVSIDWNVKLDNETNIWVYNYTFKTAAANNKNLEGFDLSVGSAFNTTDLLSSSMTVYTTHDATGSGSTINLLGLGTYTENVGLLMGTDTKTVSGLKWEIPLPSSGGYYSFDLSLSTLTAPIWGDFIAQGLDSLDYYQAAWNNNLGVTQSIATNLPNIGSILTPGAAPVPIPPAVFLFGSGLSGLFFLRRKKFVA